MFSDRTALIAAILANPEEDTPRLACADWFEEQGDEASVARAAFIRTQIERENLEPGDLRQGELHARELRLLKQYAKVWCGSHFVFSKARFRRGFIEYVHLHMRHFLFHRRQMLALEPVRDVSLTGWMRATDDLVQRVAACEEWKHIETLRIHHQGPHKSPRSNLVLLLESPHFTRLRSLRVPMLALNADARRRFERSPAVRSVRELTLPHLDTYPDDPGHWLSDGGPLEPWENLRSLRLREYWVRPELLTPLSEMPFWNELTELDISLGWSRADQIDALRSRLPNSLRCLRLTGGEQWEGGEVAGLLFRRIGGLPLRKLHLHNMPLTADELRSLLDQSSRCELQELTLSRCGLTQEHAWIIAESDRLRGVQVLDLSGNWDTSQSVIDTIFASDYLPESVTRLNLLGTRLGGGAVATLASDKWSSLRMLELTGEGIPEAVLRHLFRSTTFQRLATFVYDSGFRGEATPITPLLASALVQLPNLASLRIENLVDDPDVTDTLAASESPAWTMVYGDDRDVAGVFHPSNLPPLDEYQTGADQ
ncbi:MAG: hypothetical protein C0467_10670 [Planctomycetaceae bacterium]|nr:hypothetical protein [Planctomycetaceae bacterium]